MKSTNKILFGIVFGVILLVVIAFVVTLRQPLPSYQDETTPDGVAHNYLLALRQSDYARAYTYLSPTLPGYPHDLDRFIQDVELNSWRFRLSEDVSLSIRSTNAADHTAIVTVRETRHHTGFLGGSESVNSFRITLHQNNGVWKISDAENYWSRGWAERN